MKNGNIAPLAGKSSVSQSTTLIVGVLFGTLAFEVAVLRFMGYSFLNTYSFVLPAKTATTDVPTALLLIAVPAFVYIALGLQRTRKFFCARLRMTVAVGCGAGLAVLASHLVPANLSASEWLTLHAFSWVRWDLLFVLVLAVASALALEFTSGRWRTALLVVVHAVVFVLMVLPAASFLHMLALGTPGGWYDFKFFLLSAGDLLPVLASEASFERAAFLLLPLAVLALPHVLGKVLPEGTTAADEAEAPEAPEKNRRVAVMLRMAAVALPLAALLCLPPGRWLPFQQPKSFYGGLLVEGGSDLLTNPVSAAYAEPLEGTAGSETPGFFDTKTLRLAPVHADSSAAKDGRPRNVVFVLLESVRRRSITPYDSTLQTTPFLDSLSSNALLVEEMTSVIPQTNKSFVPIFAGIYPRPVSRIVEGTPGGLAGRALPALLRERGYATGYFSSATKNFRNLPGLLENIGFSHAADYSDFSTEGFEEVNYFGYEGRIMTTPSMAWVDSVRQQEQPFFAAYLNTASHHPYTLPSKFEKESFADNEQLNNYLNAVHYADDWLRELFAEYEKRGLLESTLFVIVGDHGQAFGEHGQKTHGDIIWEEALEVPALIYHPRLFEGGRVASGPRQQTDLMPTVAEVLGYEVRGGTLPGRSLLDPSDSRRALYHFTRNPSQYMALRKGERKFIYSFDRNPMQVFDLKQDPMERNDIAARFSDIELRKAKRQMLRWRQQVEWTYSQNQNAN